MVNLGMLILQKSILKMEFMEIMYSTKFNFFMIQLEIYTLYLQDMEELVRMEWIKEPHLLILEDAKKEFYTIFKSKT